MKIGDNTDYQWVIDNYTPSDMIYTLVSYDEDDEEILIFCSLYSKGVWRDKDIETSDWNELTVDYATDESDEQFFSGMFEFKKFLEECGIEFTSDDDEEFSEMDGIVQIKPSRPANKEFAKVIRFNGHDYYLRSVFDDDFDFNDDDLITSKTSSDFDFNTSVNEKD